MRKDIAKDGEKTRFTSENQPDPASKSRAGVPNRATLLKKWLSVELDLINPVTRDKERGTVEDEVMLALITKARKGDVQAIKEVLDTTYGKLSDKTEIGGDGSPIEIMISHVSKPAPD